MKGYVYFYVKTRAGVSAISDGKNTAPPPKKNIKIAESTLVMISYGV